MGPEVGEGWAEAQGTPGSESLPESLSPALAHLPLEGNHATIKVTVRRVDTPMT